MAVALPTSPVWKSNLQPDFNVRACERFDATLSAVLRELDESNRSVQKSAESTSI
ncbi:glutathione S-transferase [Aureococcus anophagefferens]|uniref:Glutathione S-transferase n=1 Tax=Aureococcus anophagefferens TaxID=44056 RepID=A0ABR1FZQ5_AURAN